MSLNEWVCFGRRTKGFNLRVFLIKREIMKKVFVLVLVLTIFTAVGIASASDRSDNFREIRILDDIMVYVDADGMIKDSEVKAYALAAFEKYMRGMKTNDDAYVDNYPAKGYKHENVGYIIIKIMSIRTEGGVNAYHLDFEFGIPPRRVYWDTAMMGIAPTTFDFKKELLEDVDEVMQMFAKAFYEIRGQ